MDSPISVVLTVCNRWETLERSLDSLRQWMLRDDQLVVVDHFSDDWPLWGLPSERVRVILRCRPFRRAAGLNCGAQYAAHPVLFFTDADILYPLGMRELLIEEVAPGRSFFPICEDLKPGGQPSGDWRTGGYGLCAFHADDLHGLNGWDESYVEWGKEDRNLWDRAEKLGRGRKQVTGLFHQHHSTDKEFLNRYYS